MFTPNNGTTRDDGKVFMEASCLSTDTKPSNGIANGSLCLEIDTGDFYAFDEDSETWVKVGA